WLVLSRILLVRVRFNPNAPWLQRHDSFPRPRLPALLTGDRDRPSTLRADQRSPLAPNPIHDELCSRLVTTNQLRPAESTADRFPHVAANQDRGSRKSFR